MLARRRRQVWRPVWWQPAAALLVALLAACASAPAPEPQTTAEAVTEAPAETPEARAVTPDDTAMLALLRYLQAVQRMSAAEAARERAVLAATAPSPAANLRLAMLLGQARGTPDLPRALALLDGVLKSRDPAAPSMHPLARALATNYQERLRLQTQNEKLAQQLNDSQQRNAELQETIDALAAIERSLPVRPPGADNLPGGPR